MMDEIKIAKYLSGELEGDELNEVEGWLKLPENRNEFDKISQLWEESHNLKDVELFNTDKKLEFDAGKNA
ncbi:MAG: hypothetical protein HC830_12500 [Bacteroidetes bacterium]|nr:hypothetical protein [Bacteroidota bacterium]